MLVNLSIARFNLFKHRFVLTNKIGKTRKITSNISFRFTSKNNNKNSNINNEESNKNQNNTKDDVGEYFTPSETLEFKNGKCHIIVADKSQIKLVNFFTIGLTVGNVLFGYKFAKSLYYFSIFKSILWAIPLGICIRLSVGLNGNKQLIINAINLLENGKTLEIQALKTSFQITIGEMRIVNQIEAKIILANFSSNLYNDYFPVVIRGVVYLLPKKLEINNKELLSAVMDGKYINLTDDDKKINKDDIIDI